MRRVTLRDMLPASALRDVTALLRTRQGMRELHAELVIALRPHHAEIEARCGQGMSVEYVAYAIEAAAMQRRAA